MIIKFESAKWWQNIRQNCADEHFIETRVQIEVSYVFVT